MAKVGLTRSMALLPSARLLATTAIVAGTGALGASLGGMASVDRRLAAAVAPPPALQLERIAYAPGTAGGSYDCPEPAPAPRTAPSEL